MSKVLINKFDGGHAEDLRTFATDECEKSLNFDIFTNPHKLIPYGDSVAETVDSGTMAQIQLSDVDTCLISTTYYLTATGYETSSSNKPTFYIKSALTNGGTLDWTSQAVSAADTYQKNSLVIYKDKAFALGYDGAGTYHLYRYDAASTVTTIGAISSSSTFYAKPFVHPQDKILYIVIGTTITSWDGTTLTTTTTILPAGFECTSLTDYGAYLAITMRPLRGRGNSVTYLWGRDATVNTLQGVIPWGDGNTVIVENLDNILFAVMQPFSTFNTVINNKILIKSYAGGAVTEVKSISVGSTDFIKVIKTKTNNKLYFGSQNADDCLYVFGKNKEGRYVISKDRYLDNGTTTTAGIQGLSMIGDVVWRGINSSYKLMRSKVSALGESITYTATSKYLTTINPSMPILDRGKMKQLTAVRVYFTGKSGGTIAVKYAVDTTTLTSVLSESTTAIEDMKQAHMIADGSAFNAGREIQFQIESTGGVEVKGIEYEYEPLNQ